MKNRLITIGKTQINIIRKDVKNINLSVYPPEGKVSVSAPKHLSQEDIRLFLISKIGWIRKKQKNMIEQEREAKRDYIERESHYLWGDRYLLHIEEKNQAPNVEVKHNRIVMTVRPNTNRDKREEIMAAWYREEIRRQLQPLISKWEKKLDVQVNKVFIRHMKTKWGSCNPTRKNIRLNTELAKKPKEHLEYILVHELMHLIERKHNEYFKSLMDKNMPKWKHLRKELNQLPITHLDWDY